MPKEIVKGTMKLMILQTLDEGEEYGYSLAQSIRDRSDNMLKAGEGTLYPALYKLEKDGYIKSVWNEQFTPARKYYFITKKGKKLLAKETSDWKNMIKIINNYLNISL